MTAALKPFILCAALCLGWTPAVEAADRSVTRFEFVDHRTAAEVLGKEDGYVTVTGPLERMAKARRDTPVDTTGFLNHMRATVMDWSTQDRIRVEGLLTPLQAFVDGRAGDRPAQVMLVRTSDGLEDGLPHTRANAIMLPDAAFRWPDRVLSHVLAHEYFHILTRHQPTLRDKSYALIGFEPCTSVAVNPDVARLRITNPDTPLSEHTLMVSLNGQPVHLLPYLTFNSTAPDTRNGFARQISNQWLAVERNDGHCQFDAAVMQGRAVAPERLPAVFEKIGRNTPYLFHAEEILAENFALLFVAQRDQKSLDEHPTPSLLKSLRALLFP